MSYKFLIKPFEHQRQALNAGADKNLFAYFMEMGTGKTKVSVDNACYLYQERKVNVVLVVAPNSVYRNWERQIKENAPVETTVFVHKRDKKFVKTPGKLAFFLINIEAFSSKLGVQTVGKIIDEYAQTMMVIVDESTKIKNRTAKRTKSLTKICRPIAYKRILTGSPVTKSPLDLFSQCAFLSEELLGFTNFYAFRSRYCVMKTVGLGNTGKQFQLPLYFTNLPELEQKLKTFSFRVKKDECLDLPNKIYNKRYVELKGEQQQHYNNLRTFARTIFMDKEASYQNKLTEIVKLHQVACGYVVSDEGTKIEVENPKLDELLNIIEETGNKMIIWANYIHNIETIIKTLESKYGKESVVSIYGAVPVNKREQAVDDFQTKEHVRFFVGNPTTGGYGLTLTAAQTVVYFSNSYDLEVRQQSEDRAHRIGQDNKVNYIDIIANKTIDEFILKALNKKIKISGQTLGEDVLEYL